MRVCGRFWICIVRTVLFCSVREIGNSNKRMACRRHCTEMFVNVQNVLKNERESTAPLRGCFHMMRCVELHLRRPSKQGEIFSANDFSVAKIRNNRTLLKNQGLSPEQLCWTFGTIKKNSNNIRETLIRKELRHNLPHRAPALVWPFPAPRVSPGWTILSCFLWS